MAKPKADALAIVTATTNRERSRECRWSWEARARYSATVYMVEGVYGSVPAFAVGVRRALDGGHAIIACLHDDLLIEEDGWDQRVLDWFQLSPQTGLVGFLGGTGLGDADIYQKPYHPHQLARQGVVSNERNAEAHGRRVTQPTRVACLDGFSQIGRAAFWWGYEYKAAAPPLPIARAGRLNLFQGLADLGMVHHYYDGQLGVEAACLGWEVWMLPVACHHYGGRTAVGDPGYQEWAKAHAEGGDQGFWEQAHKIGYHHGRGILPLRVK